MLKRGLDTSGIGAFAALLLLTATWTWWGIKQGAYFGVVLYPGLVLLCAGLVVLLHAAPWRANLGLSRPTVLALGGVFGLAAWSALSAIWSPSPDVALADAQRIAVYGLAFVLGLWLCNLLGPRMQLALAPLAIAGALAGLVTLFVLAFGDDVSSYLEINGTLQYPLGYRNANAAFFAIAAWPALALAQWAGLSWSARAAALGAATLCLELALLSQSRGFVIAGAAAIVVYAIFTPGRARAILWLCLAALPALVVLPALSDLYAAANDSGLESALTQLPDAARAALGGCALAIIAGAVAVRVEARFKPRPESVKRADRVATGGLIAVAVIAVVGFVVATGDPVDWVGQRVDEFQNEGTPDLSAEPSRFGFNTGSERLDLWEIAVQDAAADPLFGDGAGGYQYSYLQDRSVAAQNVRDAHSVELEVLSELGAPGLILLGLAIAGALVGALRARRLGPAAAALSAAALTAFAYWIVHSSIDWFWAYPAITAPVFALLGSACAPALLTPQRPDHRAHRWIALVVVVLAVSAIPPYLSERYTNQAFATWAIDLDDAYADLDRAATLNPLSEEPLMAEGAIAREAGDTERAITAFREAADLRDGGVGRALLPGRALRGLRSEVGGQRDRHRSRAQPAQRPCDRAALAPRGRGRRAQRQLVSRRRSARGVSPSPPPGRECARPAWPWRFERGSARSRARARVCPRSACRYRPKASIPRTWRSRAVGTGAGGAVRASGTSNPALPRLGESRTRCRPGRTAAVTLMSTAALAPPAASSNGPAWPPA